jgi:hypothetical protein
MPFSQMGERQRKSFIYRIMKPLVKGAGWKHVKDRSDTTKGAKRCKIDYNSSFSFVYRPRTEKFVCPEGHHVPVPCNRASWGRHPNAGTCKNSSCPGRSTSEKLCFHFYYDTETMRVGDIVLSVREPKLPSLFKAIFDLKQWPEKLNYNDDAVEIASLIDVDTLEDTPWDVTKHEWVNLAKTKMPKTPAGLVLRTIQQNTNMQGQLMSDYDKQDPNKPYFMGNTFLRLTDDRLPCSVVFEFSEEGRMLVRLGGQNGRVWLTLGEKCDFQSPEWPIETFMEKGTNIIKMMLNLEDYI